jgi:hypothetical protein
MGEGLRVWEMGVSPQRMPKFFEQLAQKSDDVGQPSTSGLVGKA